MGGRGIPLAAFCLVAVVDLGSLAVGFTPGHVVAKPLLMPLLAVYARVCGGPRLLVAALLCGWGGDVLLLFDAEPAFLAGMGCFAAGHVCYLVLFGRPALRAPAWVPPAYVFALLATVSGLWPDLPADLRVPVAGYSALLVAMAAAATRMGLAAGIGGALFVLSDMLIATGVAGWPQLARPDLWIMLTYVAAQFLLVSGVLKALGTRSAPAPAYGETSTDTP
ncbi:hypothetical protein SGFS_088690 [Streptomyces graminofaciens]|uniref:Lysoplasmalogenase n=1 Tax=Streptomyces graminofaciens TaxID=68212 RepID=A0ABM8HJT2_9ACTN|nr:lysoplasmalogenase [Streptomyces graminofaciens]BBC37575.1 hypothetical protein SGFS_088690 [Streptomyces graminofaciens]